VAKSRAGKNPAPGPGYSGGSRAFYAYLGHGDYIDAVAKAGKDIYDLPMYINIAGPARDYDVLDIWKLVHTAHQDNRAGYLYPRQQGI